MSEEEPGGFLPPQLSGLAFWVRADKGITLGVGAGVAAWANQSGADITKTLVQAVAIKQPTYSAHDAAYNGSPSVAFASAAQQFMTTAAWSSAVPSPSTLYVVGNDDGTTNEQVWLDNETGAGTESLFYNTGASTYNINQGGNFLAASTPLGQRMVSIGVFAASASLYINAKTPSVTGTIPSGSRTGLTAGNIISSVIGLNGKLVEIAIYSRALSPAEINRLLTYGGSRYAITIGA